MDLDLPELDIIDCNDDGLDIAIIMEEDIEKNEELEKEKKQPFIKKEKKEKKELSEKQKAHLDKIRGMALEKRQEKAKAKKEAVDKVVLEIDNEHKPKYYKPKPKMVTPKTI